MIDNKEERRSFSYNKNDVFQKIYTKIAINLKQPAFKSIEDRLKGPLFVLRIV